MTDSDPHSANVRLPLTVLLLAIVVGGAVDLVLDAPGDWRSLHVLYELALILGAIGIVVWLWRGRWRAEASAGRLRQTLAERQAERDAWRARAERALDGLGRAVDEQFAAWHLTPAEREVALFLLKGQGHKQVAAATGRSERTVRQHAVAVYHKSGLQGRAELAAFFLADLRVPDAGDAVRPLTSGISRMPYPSADGDPARGGPGSTELRAPGLDLSREQGLPAQGGGPRGGGGLP